MAPSNYADFGDSEIVLAPQRTSILAIFSLICALICVIPGLGVLATMFGIAAIIGISGSKGRVGGTGLAATGIVLGLLFSMLWIGAFYGAGKFANIVMGGFAQPTAATLTALDSNDLTTVRSNFVDSANAAIKDEDLIKFREAYQAELGPCTGLPTNLIEFAKGYSASGVALKGLKNNVQGRQDIFPMPLNFGKGQAIVIAVFDSKAMNAAQGGPSTAPGTPGFKLPLANIIILTTDGKHFALRPDELLFPSSTPTPAAPLPAEPTSPAPTPEPPK